jgi:hypothetical protein
MKIATLAGSKSKRYAFSMEDLSDPTSLLSHFSMSTIIASFLFGIVGLYVFRHGKKTTNYSLIFTSIAMMVYPMFVSGAIITWCMGIALCALAYYLNENHNLTG